MIDRERKPSRGSDEYCIDYVWTEQDSWYKIAIQCRIYYGLFVSRNQTRGNCSKRYCCNSHSSIAAKLHTDSRMPLARDLSRRCFSQNGRGKRGKRTRGKGKGKMRTNRKSNNNNNNNKYDNNHNNTSKVEKHRRARNKERIIRINYIYK